MCQIIKTYAKSPSPLEKIYWNMGNDCGLRAITRNRQEKKGQGFSFDLGNIIELYRKKYGGGEEGGVKIKYIPRNNHIGRLLDMYINSSIFIQTYIWIGNSSIFIQPSIWIRNRN